MLYFKSVLALTSCKINDISFHDNSGNMSRRLCSYVKPDKMVVRTEIIGKQRVVVRRELKQIFKDHIKRHMNSAVKIGTFNQFQAKFIKNKMVESSGS